MFPGSQTFHVGQCDCPGHFCQQPRKAAVIGFGLGGHSIEYHAQRGSKTSMSGYETPETFLERLNAGTAYHWDYTQGAWVVDKRALLKHSHNPVGLVLRAPLLDPDLPAGTMERLEPVDPIFAGAVQNNEYGSMLEAQALCEASFPNEPGPLDYVSIDRYLEYWRLAGARIGQLVDGQILWEDILPGLRLA
jgi:hypothetical protein